MDIQQITIDTEYSVRTQISLSPSLYRLLKERAKNEEKSMSAVIRENLISHFQEKEKKRELDIERLKRLANAPWEVLRNEKGGWRTVKNPHKLIRKWRLEDDKKREEMMAKALR